jgi:hypothetical protein
MMSKSTQVLSQVYPTFSLSDTSVKYMGGLYEHNLNKFY